MAYCIASSSSRWLHHETNGEPRTRHVDTGNLERPTPELTDAYNAANEAISVTYGTREPRRLVTRWRSRTVAKVDSIPLAPSGVEE
jgi:hypothetical protein